MNTMRPIPKSQMTTRREYTSALNAVMYECTVPAAEVIARLDEAVNKDGRGSKGPLPDLPELSTQEGLEAFVEEKSGDHFLYFIDYPFYRLPGLNDENAEGANDTPLVVTYTIGGPIFAQQIIALNPWAAVCIPPRLVVVEKPDRSGTSVYFHTTSSVMGMEAHEGEPDRELTEILAVLDMRVEALIAEITAETPDCRVTM